MKTVPPPDGEEDPYGAPTRVAPLTSPLLELMRERAEESANAKENAHASATQSADAAADENELAALAAAATHVVAPALPEPVSVAVEMQSGRTVPLSSALLAQVIKSVDDKRALAHANAAAATPAEAAPAVAVRRRAPGSVLALVLVLVLGLSVLAAGIVMFLDATS